MLPMPVVGSHSVAAWKPLRQQTVPSKHALLVNSINQSVVEYLYAVPELLDAVQLLTPEVMSLKGYVPSKELEELP